MVDVCTCILWGCPQNVPLRRKIFEVSSRRAFVEKATFAAITLIVYVKRGDLNKGVDFKSTKSDANPLFLRTCALRVYPYNI
jgi:hypothetical protein